MKAVVLERVCTPQELQITEVPIPIVKPGWVLVKIRAFGINRSEMFTRQGHSPSVQFPRIMGIECVGEIEDPSDSTFIKGTAVASLMGGLGRAFDGSYAEYALIPSDQVYPIPRDMKWTELAAIPEMYYTAYASLFECLQLTSGEMLLIRGGTSSVGLAALQLAKSVGATVISTTRDKEKFALLQQAGADYALLDNEHLREQVYAIAPNGVNKVLELVGTPTVKESLQFISERGICCMSGILGNEWTLDAFEPLVDIPTGVYFTAFTSEVIKESTLIPLFEHLQKHGIVPPIARVFTLEEIGEAHLLMESNTANGKIVISYEIERGLNMTITENKQLMHRFTNFINTASKELAEELISPDAVFYVPMQKEPMNGPNGYLSIIHMMRSGFSDIQWTVKELVAEEDLIAAHFVMKGTQDGVFLGFPPTGKKIEVNAMNFYRISNGQIIEEYGQPDMLGLLQQIGAIPKA